MPKDAQSPTLDQAVGAALRAWRRGKGWTQDDAAEYLRTRGLPWSRAALAAAELGTKTFDLAEFVVLCHALGRPPAKWFDGDGWLELRPGVLPRISADGLRSTFGGARAFRSVNPSELVRTDLDAFAAREAEQKAARLLGVGAEDLARAASRLWGHGLVEERERLVHKHPVTAGASARKLQAARGVITRQLLKELTAALRSSKAGKSATTRKETGQ
jgi:transcriptional regulator with XRE-family HTH domain